MEAKASIKNLIISNPSGLLEMQQSLPYDQYLYNYGFGLKNVCTIFKSRRVHHSGNDWYKFTARPLSELFTVQEESNGNLLVVFIVDTMKDGLVYCHLVLSDKAWAEILSDKSQHVLAVHQMYTQYFTDHITLNMSPNMAT